MLSILFNMNNTLKIVSNYLSLCQSSKSLLTSLDSPSSSVQGIVTEEGHFDGHISTPTEYFYIEPAKR